MNIIFTEEQIQGWLQEGLRSAMNSLLRDGYGTGAALKRAVDKAISESEMEIVAALKVGISQAVVSKGFMKKIELEIANSLSSQYRGAFEGVIRAAAKQAASNEVIARRVAELTREGAGLNPEDKP